MFLYIIYIFIIIGIIYIILNKRHPDIYILLTIFFLFKFIFNYRKCTISYYECKLRGVKKEYGYLYNFMENILNYRNTHHIYPIYIFLSIVLYYHFIIKKNLIII